jgi:hypothetical protein
MTTGCSNPSHQMFSARPGRRSCPRWRSPTIDCADGLLMFRKKLRLWIAPRGPHRRLHKVAYPCSGPRLHKSWSKALSAGSAYGDAGSEAGNRDGCPRNGNLNALAFTGGDSIWATRRKSCSAGSGATALQRLRPALEVTHSWGLK